MSDFRQRHEVVVFIVRTVTGPNLRSWFDVLGGNKHEIRMFANLFDARVLKVGFYSVYLAGSKIDAAHVAAVSFTIDILVRVRLFPRAFRYGRDIVIAMR